MVRLAVFFIYLIPQLIFAQKTSPNSAPKRKFAEVLAQFQQAPEYQSTVATLRAIDFDFASRDLVLQPVLELSAHRLNDRRMTLTNTAVSTATTSARKARVDTMSALLTKPFSTGTTLTVTPVLERALFPTLDPRERSTFDWQVGISQSLWRDGFGRSTRLRWARESAERKQQIADLLAKQAQLQVEFESLYWDWAMAVRERELRAKNVSRGRDLLKYIRGRFARSAAENSDVLQAQALLERRELELMAVEQNVVLAASRMEKYVPGIKWQPDPSELDKSRDFEKLVTPWQADDLNETLKLDLVAARNAAFVAERRADEAREQIRPDLNLQLAYGKNAIDPDSDTALRQGTDGRNEFSSIGVVFKTGLDLGQERRKVEAARASRDSAKLHREALESEGRVAWAQYKRNIADLQARIQRAGKLAEVQEKKVVAERQRYRLGRTNAFQAITFEQDAADAEITYWNLNAQLRKTEAQARLFAR